EATLVLSESQASAGLAWYNAPDDPSEAPAQIYELLAPTTETGTVITSADILSSPSYAGGLIGFALTKFTDSSMSATYAIYYSEYQRNALCSACSMPDHWKMMLVYGSTVFENTFYFGALRRRHLSARADLSTGALRRAVRGRGLRCPERVRAGSLRRAV
ncbi:MAG TPA: hypothetical protein VFU02_08910, partial [Polyangiaceae bacterium]|nr:hypothetical protein [Polyangiaceae bacterium]